MELLDIGHDCLREICDRMDLLTLSAVAGTNCQLQQIACQSFVSRKISRFVYYQYDVDRVKRHEFRTYDSCKFVNVLCAFGHLIANIRVCFKRWHRAENTDIFNHIVQRCSGTLRSLTCQDTYEGFYSHQMLDATELLANLTKLEMKGCNDIQDRLPLTVCRRLTTLAIHQTDSNDCRAYLKNTFPRLRSLHVHARSKCIDQVEFDDMVRRHPELSEVTVDVASEINYTVLAELPKLSKLTITLIDVRILAVAGLGTLKSIRIEETRSGNRILIQFIDRLAMRDKLQQLHLPRLRFDDPPAVWRCLCQLVGLRILSLRYDTIVDRDLANGIAICLQHLPQLRIIYARRNRFDQFKMNAFKSLDAVCQQMSIHLTIAVWSDCIRLCDLSSFSRSAENPMLRNIHFGKRIRWSGFRLANFYIQARLFTISSSYLFENVCQLNFTCISLKIPPH